MTVSVEKIADLRLKNLEMLQGVISRMAGYGASFKSYCITVATGVIGFGITLHSPAVALLALIPVFAFAVADAQYLRVERRFRALFEGTRKEPWDIIPTFNMDLNEAPPQSFASAASSWSIVWFYGPLATAVVIAVIGVKIDG